MPGNRLQHPLRREAEQHCGRVLRDRGEALYLVSKEPEGLIGLRMERHGEKILLLPNREGMLTFSLWLAAAPVFGFERFASSALSPQDASLFSWAVKLFENGRADKELDKFSRAVRQYAAVVLRTKCSGGGAIPVCMQILEALAKTTE